jgi:hypothetical protein
MTAAIDYDAMSAEEYAAHLVQIRRDLGFDEIEGPRPVVLELPERPRIGMAA